VSYPSALRILIIEDENTMTDAYKASFDTLRKSFNIGEIRFAQSFEDARNELAKPQVIHVAILDLHLPTVAGGDADSARGLDLVNTIAARERYPIPVLLIVTGHTKSIGQITRLDDRVRRDFWHGAIIAKSIDLIEDLRLGLAQALEFLSFGVLIGDEEGTERPLITPREDLLLRIAARDQQSIGVDLVWWSGERRDFGASPHPGWVKVLYGRYLYPTGGPSRQFFFKFESKENGERAHRSAKRLESKLQHVQVITANASSDRALLITAKAGVTDDVPMRVAKYLREPGKRSTAELVGIARDISSQLQCFEKSAPIQRKIGSIPWNPPGLDRQEWLERGWHRLKRTGTSPAEVYSRIVESEKLVWVRVRDRHGDLHIDNVTLDRSDGTVHAYIFDAGAIESGICAQDLAAFEVSLLLHQAYEVSQQPLVHAAEALFDGSSPTGATLDESWSDHQRNTVALLNCIRQEALAECSQLVYAVMLMDYLLIQLAGLSAGTSHNKVFAIADVASLYERLTRWLGVELFKDDPRELHVDRSLDAAVLKKQD
jgi:hypothetical protein